MKKIFAGELMKIDPYLLIYENGDDKLGSFFLRLGIIFNDLKCVLLFQELLKDNYEQPKSGDETTHAGNYYGTLVYMQRLIAGIIWEFFEFLKNNYKIFNNGDFKTIFNKISKSDQRLWEQLINASNNKLNDASDLLNSLVKIRNNIAFHYDHSGKIILRGYRNRFFDSSENCGNKYAYYSIGENIKLTRFYFSDAAVEESLYTMAGKKLDENIKGNESLIKYQEQVWETITVISTSMISLIKNFIQFQRNHPITTVSKIKT